jgi:TP901 family phage tail tape measure protein
MSSQLRLQMIFSANQKVTGPMNAISKGSSELTAKLKGSTDALKALNQQQNNIDRFRALKSTVGDTAKAMEIAQDKVRALAAEIAKVDQPTKAMTRAFEKAKTEAGGLKSTYQGQVTDLQRLRTELKGSGIDTSDLSDAQKKLRDRMAATSTEISEQRTALGKLSDRESKMSDARAKMEAGQASAANLAIGGAAALGAGAAIGAPILASVQSAAQFEGKMTSIGQKADMTRAQTLAMGDDFRAAGAAANQTAENIQRGVDVLTGFGMGAGQAVKAMEPIGRAATAYVAEISDLSAASFSGIDNLKVPVESTAKMLDVMAFAGKKGAFEMRDMAQYFPSLTAAAKGLGQQGVPAVADLSAALQITRKGAGDSASAANNLLNLMNKINTEDATKKFKKFGVDLPRELKKAAAAGQSPIEAIAELTKKATGGDLSKLSLLFADAQVQAAMRPLIQNLEEYKTIRESALGATNVVNTDFAERLKDTAEAEKAAAIQAQNLSLSIGQKLLPAYSGILRVGAGALQWMTNFAAAHPGLTKAVAILAAGIALTLIVVGGLGLAMAGVVGSFAIFKFGLVGLFGPTGLLSGALNFLQVTFWRLTAAIFANPIILVVAAIAVAVFLIYRNWDGISAWFSAKWVAIKSAFSSGWQSIKTMMAGFSLSQIGYNMTVGLAVGIMNAAGRVWGALKSVVMSGIAKVREVLNMNSPSRVFMGLGGGIIEGLSLGIAKNEDDPVNRLGALSTRLGKTMAVAGSLAAITAAPAYGQAPTIRPAGAIGINTLAPANGPAAGRAAPVVNNYYEISIDARGNSDPASIKKAVKEVFEEIEDERAARDRSRYDDR